MKTSLLIATIITALTAGAFAGPGPAYHGQSPARILPSSANAACKSMLIQTAGGKLPASVLDCSVPAVGGSAFCRSHCG